jgi:outer membrane protein assembly factor BamA
MIAFNPQLFSQQKKIPVYFTNNQIKKNKHQITIDSIDKLTPVIKKIQNKNIEKGYLSFSVDSIISKPSQIMVYSNQGARFYFGRLTLNDSIQVNKGRIKPGKPFSIKGMHQIEKQLLQNVQNQGFPLARLNKETRFDDSLIHIKYTFEKGNYYEFDTLKQVGENPISLSYLEHKTGIKPGKAYNTQLVNQLAVTINRTGFLKLDSLSVIQENNRARVILKIDKHQQNSFSGILGLMTNTEQKTEITGQINFNLVNLFKKGETIQIDWQKFASQSQDLNAFLKAPYIFKTPLGLLAEIKFYKQDSSYANTDLLAGLLIDLGKKCELAVTAHKNISTTTLNKNDNYSNSENLLYGLRIEYNTVNNRANPAKGIFLQASVETGNNTHNINTENRYTSLFTQAKSQAIYFIKVPLGTLKLKHEAALIINDSLPLNAYQRLGGFSGFRGVNEKSIFAQAFSFFTAEYRFAMGGESYVYLFTDAGWFNEPQTTKNKLITRQAAGAGINLKTKAGTVSVAYALGNSSNETFNIQNAKIHIGYTNRF